MKKSILAVILIISAFFCAFGQNSGSIDLVLLLDTSSAMGSSYERVNDYITGAFLSEFLRTGDTFHLITFSASPRLDIARRISERGDVETIIGRMLIQYPVETGNDAMAAVNYVEAYISTLPPRPKKIVMVSAGGSDTNNIVSAAKQRLGSKNATLDFVSVTGSQPIANLPSSGRPSHSRQTSSQQRPPSGTTSTGTVSTTPPAGAVSSTSTTQGTSAAQTTQGSSQTGTQSTQATSQTGAQSTTQGTSQTGAQSTQATSQTGAQSIQGTSQTGAQSIQGTSQTGAQSITQGTSQTGTQSTQATSQTGAQSTTQGTSQTGTQSTQATSQTGAQSTTQATSQTGAQSTTQATSQTGAQSTIRPPTVQPDSSAVSASGAAGTGSSAQGVFPSGSDKGTASEQNYDFSGQDAKTTSKKQKGSPVSFNPTLLLISVIIAALLLLTLLIIFVSRRLGSRPNRVMASISALSHKKENKFIDHSKDLANYAASQNKKRATPYSNKPVKEQVVKQPVISPTGPLLLNLFVEDQNTSIGKRNIHSLKSGYSLSVGGGKSDDFMIFLVPMPPHLGDIRRNGSQLTFIPHRPKYFPDIGSNEIRDCINKKIRVVSDKNYEMLFSFVMYEDPLIALNRVLHSIKVPG